MADTGGFAPAAHAAHELGGARGAVPVIARVLLVLGLAAAPSSAMPAPSQLRQPQVPVSGTGLQQYLNGVGETIDARTDQWNAQLLESTVSNNVTFTLQLELGPHTPGTVLGIYAGTAAVPDLMPVFPGSSAPGWFAVVSFRNSPTRVIVNLFDAAANFLGHATFPGGDRNAIGFYLATANTTWFSQDDRNPSGEPRCLLYPGTGIDAGSVWLAWEDGDPADSDFDDSIVFDESVNIDPVRQTTWGALKSRFR